MALIDSSMFGIPFEGRDYYADGTGGMKGVIVKVITLFDQAGSKMDKAWSGQQYLMAVRLQAEYLHSMIITNVYHL